ncbi:uncharacterized protein MELLADRAFT_96200 [Melampsora larici-populina 98AG31]|uniref:Uncharacterized protein n=1 Tax=Melampsora larici-populina (strain 98AG31 / pathotype 3-4-7) TaxID=747676 RepID=F4SBB5_MELLP|nr:uncharacterized protein MELLADRAFT_96200 [Melampsora larici-populina 98AG31]EGF98063.1 hypothetical protein MELLADRAFT_96200 [Melampsora larici-populina 98AG31]
MPHSTPLSSCTRRRLADPCNKPKNSHNWRTWRCDQFNHKRALINAGAPRPIISCFLDWGPRISPNGVILPPKPTRDDLTNRAPPLPRDGHPFLGPVEQEFTPFKNQLDSLAGPQRSKVSYPCQRASRGPVARGHRTTGNKSCPYQYCQSCCLAYGLGACLKHVRPLAPSVTQRPASETATHVPTPSTSALPHPPPQALQPSARAQPAPAPRIHQWAQSVNSLGHRLGIETVSAIQIDRRERYKAVDIGRANKYDERKVVTIHLWLDALEYKVISAHMEQWPKARLEESPLLMQACTRKFGATWNRAICFWDEKIDNWVGKHCHGQPPAEVNPYIQHETMVSFPHRYPANKNEIIVKSPNLDPWTPGLPQSNIKAFAINSSHDPLPKTTLDFLEDADNTDDVDVVVVNGKGSKSHPIEPEVTKEPEVTVTKEPTPTPTPTPVNTFDPNSLDNEDDHTHNVIAFDREDSELPHFDPMYHSPKGADRPLDLIADSQQTASPVLTDPSTTNPTTTTHPNTVKKKGWPSSSLLITDLLSWYRDCEIRAATLAWKDTYGSEWVFARSTVHRYKNWINEVTYRCFSAEYTNFPLANVGDAREVFKKEFKSVL